MHGIQLPDSAGTRRRHASHRAAAAAWLLVFWCRVPTAGRGRAGPDRAVRHRPGGVLAALLGKRLRAKGYGYAVVNASITGDTTTGGLKRLPRWRCTTIVIIELGGNGGCAAP